jgi:hypothetical protein
MTGYDAEAVGQATAPARWLLDHGVEGVPLTARYALARVVVRDVALRWPEWWNAELFGPPHREADLAVLGALHEGLRRLKLMRRRGRKLYATALGRQLAARPALLLEKLVADLGAADPYAEMIASGVIADLAAWPCCTHDDLVAPALKRTRRGGWRGPDHRPPAEDDVSWTIGDVLRRGEAYGLIERHPDPSDSRRLGHLIALSAGGRSALGLGAAPVGSSRMPILVFDAELTNVRGVGARLAVRADQHLTALHDAIQEAFGWEDDHLYSFWLDGRFWGERTQEYTSPVVPDEAPQTADVPLAELDLSVGRKIAYVFDFGDEWRVRLTLREQTDADDGRYPQVLQRKGSAPPQYPDLDEEPSDS